MSHDGDVSPNCDTLEKGWAAHPEGRIMPRERLAGPRAPPRSKGQCPMQRGHHCSAQPDLSTAHGDSEHLIMFLFPQ